MSADEGALASELTRHFELATDEGADKLVTLEAAVELFVQPGDVIHVAYSDARPNAAVLQLVRRFAGQQPRLTLVTAGVVSVQHILVELGIVDKVVASFAGENYPAARPNPAFQRAVADGRVSISNWSLWSLTARLVAGALGISHFPVHSLAGSGMEEEHLGEDYAQIPDPFGDGTSVGVVSALRPDVVLLQGVAADRHGNVVMATPYGESHWGALAARRGVIACVERIVSTEEIRAHSSLVRIPAHAVIAVAEVPFGSHPYGIYNQGFPGVPSYVEDGEFIGEVFEASRSTEGLRAWADEWVLGTRDHGAYLERLGAARLDALCEGTREDLWKAGLGALGEGEGWNENELLVTAAARQVAERVRDHPHETVLAGVGLANLSAWLAVGDLKRGGHDVELMAEIGMYGYDPRPGEPFIFANRNLPTCKLLTDVMGVLGTFVSGPRTSCLGVIGAGQIDGQGNTNSTYAQDGRFLVGSGGANDIASAAQELVVVVPHRLQRLVHELPYITCPGGNVRTIVTSAGVFERSENGFLLTRYLGGASDNPRAAVQSIRAECGWDFEVASSLRAEPEPTRHELSVLRSYDPERVFLRGERNRPHPAGWRGSA